MKEMRCRKCKDDLFYDTYMLASCYSVVLCKQCLADWNNYAIGLEEFRELSLQQRKLDRAVNIKAYAGGLELDSRKYWELVSKMTQRVIEWLNTEK